MERLLIRANLIQVRIPGHSSSRGGGRANRLWTSVIVFGELHFGVSLLDEGARRRSLVTWLGRQRAAFGDRCLPVRTRITKPDAKKWLSLG
jgi:hypothetical protein